MKVQTDTSGVNRLLARLENVSDNFDEQLLQAGKQCAENMRKTAQGIVYGPNLRHETGETGDSIAPYTTQTEDMVSFGISTRNLRTIYHEMGTGPVGTAAGYPGEADVDSPIVRRSTAWSFWSDSIPVEGGGVRSGFVKTEGVPPKAFMHNAVMQETPEAERVVRNTLEGMLRGK